jgi:RNA polymerase sigma-70 factor (ECF subfamily)
VRVRVRSGTIVAMSAVSSPLPQTLDPERLSDHADRLMRIARRLTGSREGAEDLVQDTFERVLRKPRSLAGDEIAYLVGALRNTHIARLRAASRRIQPEAVPEGFDLPDRRHDDTVTALHAREILNAVAALPEQYRAAVVAVDLQGQSYDEAAMRLGMPRGTVQSRAFRGRARVARAVGDTNLNPDRVPVF